MNSETLVRVILAVLALAIGIALGLPGRDPRTPDEIEADLLKPGGRKKAKRSFTPLDMLHKRRRASESRRDRPMFRPVVPEDESSAEDTPERD